MPQLAVAAIGAYVGGAALGTTVVALGMTGAQIGFAVGSMIGSAMFAPTAHSTGPRLADLKAGALTYGSVLPYVEGHPRLPGIPIWGSILREIENTSGSGGKGGGGSEQTTFTYEQDVLFKLSENTCWALLRRVWKNGALVFSRGDDASADTIDASDTAELWDEIIFYDGNGDQLPDPTYEAVKGVGHAPAYRGCMTIMIKGLKLGTTKQLPNLTFEGTPAGDMALFDARRVLHDFALTDYAFDYPRGASAQDGALKVWGIRSGHVITYTADPDTYALGATSDDTIPAGAVIDEPGQMNGDRCVALFGGVTGHFYLAGDGIAHDYTVTGTPTLGTDALRGSTWNNKVSVARSSGASNLYLLDLVTGTQIGSAVHGLAVSSIALTTSTIFALSGSTVYPYDTTTFAAGATFALPAGTGHRIYTTMQGALACSNAEQQVYVRESGAWVSLAQLQAGDAVDLGTASAIHVVDGTNVWAVRCYDNPDPITRVLTTFDQAHATPGYNGLAANTVINVESFAPPVADLAGWTDVKGYAVGWTWDDRGSIAGNVNTITPTWDGVHVTTYAGGTTAPDQVHSGTSGLLTVTTINEIVPFCAATGTIRWTGQFPPDGFQEQFHDVYKTVGELAALAEPTLQEVVERQHLRAGDDLTYVDASALAVRKVHALSIGNLSSGRQIIEILMAAYGFVRVESDVQRYVFRGADPVATIPYEDLVRDGDAEQLPIRIANDRELPVQAFVKFSNLLDDYQDGSESSDRLVSGGQNTVQIELPLGFTPAEAKRIADFFVTDAKASERHYGPFRLPRSYCYLEPTDVVNMYDAAGNLHRVRLTKLSYAGGVLTFEGVSDDAGVLMSTARTDSSGYTHSTVVPPPIETELLLLDIPLLDDADDGPGFYAGVKPTTDVSFPGAMLFKSIDGVIYESVGTSTSTAIFGTASTVLASGVIGVFDESSLLTVDVGNGELSSVTRDVLLANPKANLLLAGSEIIQFRDAALLSPGVYTLSGLLRGRRGTEWAVGTHAIGETVALLDAAIQRVPLTTAELGVELQYKAVTLGRSSTSADPTAFTSNGVSQKPFSPDDVRVLRDSAGNITITMQRRSRLACRLAGTLGISIPLGEDNERYECDVFATSGYATVKRTLTASSSTSGGLVSFTYSAANQVTDFGGNQATVYLKTYQLSVAVGRGVATTAQG